MGPNTVQTYLAVTQDYTCEGRFEEDVNQNCKCALEPLWAAGTTAFKPGMTD